MKGYYNRPDETASIIKNGWLHTGDVGVIDKYGIKLTGRLKDIIVTSNGKNINPDEFESAIVKKSPYIKEVGVFMEESILQALIYPEMNQVRKIHEETATHPTSSARFQQRIAYKRIKQTHHRKNCLKPVWAKFNDSN